MKSSPTLFDVVLYFLLLSMMAIGGANAVIPDMHRQLVELRGWMSGTEFVSLVALAQAAPGPNVLIVTLIGWKLAGLRGALAATAAMCLPSSLLTYFFSKYWARFQSTHWHGVVQGGLVSVTVGLILASGYVLTREADVGWGAYAVTGVTAIIVARTNVHPLWLLAIAGVFGYFQLV